LLLNLPVGSFATDQTVKDGAALNDGKLAGGGLPPGRLEPEFISANRWFAEVSIGEPIKKPANGGFLVRTSG